MSIDDYIRKLYNATTVFTLLSTVCLYYIILYVLFTFAVNIFIPAELLENQINEEINFTSYLYIAWTATSIATIIGALGSALENEDVVLSSTYGYRQRQRHKQIKEQREQEEAEEGHKKTRQ